MIRLSRQNLFRLWLIRNILVAVLFVFLLYLWFGARTELPWAALWSLLLVMAVVNLALFMRLKKAWAISEIEFYSNLLIDISFLTAILYFTGGSTNPLVSYYLIPLIISAALLRPRYTWSIAALSVASYTMLFFYFQPLALFAQGGHGAMTGAHFLGMWINFVFSALLISWFVVRMATSMREKESQVARAREEGLRDEQIISVASIAAGTAHELRTPLATMTVLVDEMKSAQAATGEELFTLQQQLKRCDAILKDLISSTDDGGRPRTASLARLFADIQEKWAIARPEVQLDIDLPEACRNRHLSFDQSLHHALLNFLHNAADASPDHVRLAGRMETAQNGDTVLITVEDRGPGVPREIADSLGKEYISRKEGGMGLGVLLSSASIERLGGRMALLDRAGGGTRLEIRLPAQV